jgi:hypothetical protein
MGVIREQSIGEPGASQAPALLRPVIERVLRPQPEYRLALEQRHHRGAGDCGLRDCLVATPWSEHRPGEVFARLRWGGLFLFASPYAREVATVARRFAESGFMLERPPDSICEGWPIPFLRRRTHYFLARKTQLIQPGQTTERFTYQVELAHQPCPAEPLVVLKQVPSLESVVARLKPRFPEMPETELERRARKFTDKIFPTFLTREAAFLMILQEHLGGRYARRVPRPIAVEKDERGFVRRLKMTWLRNGGEPLPQMEFAQQSADLLRVLHDVARVIHLDLRLDNFVITPQGVGFVDFGSAVRVDEDLGANPLLGTLFDDLMRTSQIQRMLNQMTLSGHVTSSVICNSRHRVDKAVDFFYLAVQFNCPHSNPDLVDLIQFDPRSRDARHLQRLTAQILRPPDPAQPIFNSAKDILHAIEGIQMSHPDTAGQATPAGRRG